MKILKRDALDRDDGSARAFIRAPMELSMLARSSISGSHAAFSRWVVPSATTAAMSRFSVAPTLGNSSITDGSDKPVGRARDQHAVIDLELDAEGLKAHQVHVDLTCADLASARHGHMGLPEAGDERTENRDARAHFGNQLVGRARNC